MAYVEETDLSDILKGLRKDYKDRDLVVGYSGFEPFVTANGKLKKAALLPFFENLAEEIGCDLKTKKTTWAQFSRLVENHTIDTMLEPIIPTRRRAAYFVVPYMQMITNVLVIPQKGSRAVEYIADELRRWTSDLESGSATRDEYHLNVGPRLAEIAQRSAGNKIAVTKGVLEQDILEEYGTPMEVLSAQDISKNIARSLTRGTYIFADYPSAKIATQSTRVRSKIVHLFRNNPPFGAPCGFAVNIMNSPHLARYFAYKCKFELAKLHDLLLSNCSIRSRFDGTDFRLLKPWQVADVPITNSSHKDLIQLTTSPRLRLGQDISSSVSALPSLLGMGEEVNPPVVHLSMNIEGLSSPLSLRDMLAITKDWDSTNNRRAGLIEKKISRQITPHEDEELRHLQHLAGAKRQLVMPLPIKELAEIEAELRRRGVWPED